jgi:hypothetical protein
MIGRYDGYQDEETKLKDAIKLLEAKQNLLDNYTQQNNLNSQKSLMLAIAPSIEEAENIRTNLSVRIFLVKQKSPWSSTKHYKMKCVRFVVQKWKNNFIKCCQYL